MNEHYDELIYALINRAVCDYRFYKSKLARHPESSVTRRLLEEDRDFLASIYGGEILRRLER